jgi:ElaB/YqjD/DUF883 family membrane-anchored ribosome-binding protein
MRTSLGHDGSVKTRLARDLRHMADDAEHMLEAAVDSGDHAFDIARKKMQSQLHGLQAQLRDLEDLAGHGAKRVVRATDVAVRSHPYRVIGVAVVVGALAGWLASRR